MPSISFIKGTGVSEGVYRDVLTFNARMVPKPENPYLTTIPGLESFSSSSGKDRGGIYFETDDMTGHFRVSGNQLIEIAQGNAGPEHIEIGEITGTDQAKMFTSFKNVCIVTDRKMYLYNRTDGLRAVPSSDVQEPIDGTWINAKIYLLSYDPATKKVFIIQGEPNEDEKWQPEKYSMADVYTDKSYGIEYITGNQVAVFGRHSIEFFSDTGGTGFTLQPQKSRTIPQGIIGTNCKCQISGTYAFVGGSPYESISVFVISGSGARKIATADIEMILAKYTELELRDTRMESRIEDAHVLITLHLQRETLQYDMATQQWCRLGSDLDDMPYRGINAVYDPRYGGGWLFGDAFLPVVGKQSKEVFTQYGVQQQMILTSQFFYAPNKQITQFELKTIPGNSPQGEDTHLFVSASQDGFSYLPQGGAIMSASRGLNYRDRFVINNFGRIANGLSFRIRYQGTTGITVSTEATFNVT